MGNRMLRFFDIAHVPLIGFGAMALFWGALAALLPAFVEQSGLSDAAFGQAMFVASLAGGLCLFVAPQILTRLGALKIAGPIALFVPAFFSLAMAASFWHFALGITLAAIGSSLLDVSLNAQLSDLERRHGRPLMNGAHGVFAAMVMVVTVAAGWMRDLFLTPFQVACVLSFGLILCAIRVYGRGVQMGGPKDQADQTEPSAVPWVFICVGAAIVFLTLVAEQAGQNWAALYLERDMMARPGVSALAPALIAGTMALGRFAAQAVADRMSDGVMLAGASVLAAIGFLGAANPAFYGVQLWVVLVFFAIAGLGLSVIEPTLYSLVGKHSDPQNLPYAMSRLSLLSGTAFVVGPWAIGAISETYTLSVAFGVVGATLLAIPALLQIIRGRQDSVT